MTEKMLKTYRNKKKHRQKIQSNEAQFKALRIADSAAVSTAVTAQSC